MTDCCGTPALKTKAFVSNLETCTLAGGANISPSTGDKSGEDANCLLALQELGLEPYDIETTIRDTVDSYYALGILRA